MVSYSLDVNILVRRDATKRKLFNLPVSAIDYYRLIQPPTPTKSIFLKLNRLSLLIGLPTNPNCTKDKSHSHNCDMGRVGNAKEMPPTDLNRTESKSYDNICSKNHYNKSDGIGVQELLLDNSKGYINNYDIGKVGDKVT